MPDQSSPEVAIIVATYFPIKEFFVKQLASFRNQTYQNWICLIVDDCSSDESFEETCKLIDDDPRFKIYRNEKNLGPYYTFERGLKELPESVELITLSDQDNIWLPDFLQILVQEIKSDDSLTLVHADLENIDENDNIINKSCWALEKRSVHIYRPEFLILRNVITGGSMIIKRQSLKWILPFPVIKPPYNSFIFHDLWIALVCSLIGNIRAIPKTVIQYRQHSGNIVGSFNRSGLISRLKVKGLKKCFNWIFGTCLLSLEARILLFQFLTKRQEEINEFVKSGLKASQNKLSEKQMTTYALEAAFTGYNLHNLPFILLIGSILLSLGPSSFKDHLRKNFKFE